MPKAVRVPKHRGGNVALAKTVKEKAAIAGAEPAARLDSGIASESPDALSRGQRKRQAKRHQFMRREQMVLTSLKLKRADEQKKRIDGLDAIRDALLESVATTTTISTSKKEQNQEDELRKDNMLKSNKSRQLLLQREASQMGLVLEHPSFKADPFGTLKEHLQNTLANDAKHRQKEAVKHAKEKITKQAEKTAAKKESGTKRKRKKFKATRSKSR